MKLKSIIAVLIATVFLLGLASVSFAKGGEKGITGEVIKIEGHNVTIKDKMGKESIIDVKDVKDTKVGDHVNIHKRVITKMPDKKQDKSMKPGKAGY